MKPGEKLKHDFRGIPQFFKASQMSLIDCDPLSLVQWEKYYLGKQLIGAEADYNKHAGVLFIF